MGVANCPQVTSHLVRALELQWLLGYPLLPPGEEQLTHGLQLGRRQT